MKEEEIAELAKVLERDHVEGWAQRVRNLNGDFVFLRSMPDVAIPLGFIEHVLKNGQRGRGTTSRDKALNAALHKMLDLQGYRPVTFGTPEFDEAYLRYLAAYVALTDRAGPGNPASRDQYRHKMTFWIPERRLSLHHVMDAFAAYDQSGTPEGFHSPRSWFVIHPDSSNPYPAKIIWGLASGQVGTDFNAHQARDRLQELGLTCLQLEPEDFGPVVDLAAPPLVEGAESQATRTERERNPVARRLCIEHYRKNDGGFIRCIVCRIDFSAAYGSLGEGFIHIHHLNPLSEATGPRQIRPEIDLVPVCPNCHAMIHRGGTTRTISEVIESLQDGQRDN